MKSKAFIPTTRYLIDFLNTHISHKLDCFQSTKFSIESKKLLDILFDKMIAAEESFSKISIVSHKITKIPHGRDYDLLDPEIKSHINSMSYKFNNFLYFRS